MLVRLVLGEERGLIVVLADIGFRVGARVRILGSALGVGLSLYVSTSGSFVGDGGAKVRLKEII